MPIDIKALLDPSHFATFLGGVAIGAAAQYIGDRFTDARRKKEAKAEAKKQYNAIARAMPNLLDEMRSDLRQTANHQIRELVVLNNNRITFMHDRPRLEYYQEKHPDILKQIQMLVSAGYARDVSTTSHPIYRLSEEFVGFLLADT